MAESTAMIENSMDSSMATGPAEYPEDEWLALSGIQHFEFCKRQWALIHIEEQWRDNTRTYAGDFEHRRAHDYHASEKRGDTLILRDLRVFSRKLGVVGDCDIVEFHAAQDGVSLIGRRGRWKPYPVEYKHGSSKVNNADRLQLCGEAMCLEEMLSCSISQGALFYQRTKRREVVELNDDLRAQVVDDLAQMRDLYRRGHTPKVKPKTGCRSCSLKDICLPELVHKSSAADYIRKTLKELQG